MSILAQHGHGKSDKIDRGLDAGHLSGMILSPRYEKPEKLAEYVIHVRQNHPDTIILIDPQEYWMRTPSRLHGKLDTYQHFHPDLSDSFFLSPRNIEAVARQSIEFQRTTDTSFILSPTVMIESFSDRSCQVALTLAHETQRVHREIGGLPPLLISIVFHEQALAGRSLDEMLNTLTTFDVHGFYLVVIRQLDGYNQFIKAATLENLLKLTYKLAHINEYCVVFGYTDLLGIILQVVGATYTACGWHQSLRQFAQSRFAERTGGHTARDRYTSAGLFNSILVNPELQDCYESGFIEEVLSSTPYDNPLRSNPTGVTWPTDVSTIHHWAVLAQLTRDLTSHLEIETRLDVLLALLRGSRGLYQQLSNAGVVFEPNSGGSHLPEWQRGINDFRRHNDLRGHE